MGSSNAYKYGVFLLACFLLSLRCHGSSYENMASAYNCNDYPEALKIANCLIDEKREQGVAYFYKGRVLAEMADIPGAIICLEQAIKHGFGDPDCFLLLTKYYGDMAKKSNWLKAVGYLKKIKKTLTDAYVKHPKDKRFLTALIVFYIRTPGVLGGDIDRAIALTADFISLDAYEGNMIFAEICILKKDYRGAIDAYRKVLEINPKSAEAHVKIGAMHVILKNVDQAHSEFNHALDIDPDNINVKYQFGKMSALDMYDYYKGIEYLKLYITTDRKNKYFSNGSAYMRLGNIYEKLNDRKEAILNYEEAVRIDSTLDEAINALKRLK